ncbi:MAG: peptide deformylase [bacterium]|nr:MAG: peptide deformylase [bacterium]
MAILKVARLGHPILRKKAGLVNKSEISSVTVQTLIDDMIETMHEYEGLGLAAPQVHVSKQLVVIESQSSSRYPEAPEIPRMIMSNPEIKYLTDEHIESWEGCLSVPDLRGLVPRCQRIQVVFYDRDGLRHTQIAEDFLSIVIQHETDHLFGKVFLDRMEDLSSLSFLSEFKRHKADITLS